MDSMLLILIGVIFLCLGFSRGKALQCPSVLSIPISTSHGRTINLDDFVLNGNASFSPSQTVKLNVFTLNTPLKVKISALHEDGARSACTFLIYTKAEVCLKESLAHVSNAVQHCLDFGEHMSCTYTCNSGYVFYGGDVSRTVNCSGMNIWDPSPYPESCLKYEVPLFFVNFHVTYGISGDLASNCLQSFGILLAGTNTTISKNINERCKNLDPGHFLIESLVSTSLTFKIITAFRGRFDGFASHKQQEACIYLLEGMSNKSAVLPATSLECANNAHITVDDIGNSEFRRKCRYNTVLFTTIFGDFCVPCPAGQLFNKSMCMMCDHGFYQDEADQSVCKFCESNTISRTDRKTCISMCPPGFTSTDGLTDCKPCDRNSFWINTTHCENCPKGHGTSENGVSAINGCKALCKQGHYSPDGLNPCKPCPLHYYQYLEGQTSCQECKYNKKTYETGRISSSECVLTDIPDCNRTTLFGCKRGKTLFQNHSAFCACFEDQISSSSTTPRSQDDTVLITLIVLLCISVVLNLTLIFRICRLNSKHHKKDKSTENTNKIPNVVYDYVMDTGSTYQELGHVNVHHNYNNME